MASITPPEAELAELNREIEQLEAEQAVLEDQRQKRAKMAARAAWWQRYLQIARAVRRPAEKWEWWRMAVLLMGPAVCGVLALVLVDLVFQSTTLALFSLLLAAGTSLAILTLLFFRPADSLLASAVADSEVQARVANAHRNEASDRLSEVKQRLTKLVEDRRIRMASGRVQRAALLQRPWKGMSGVEWEDFVVEVCRTLGATVDRRGHSDQGAEMVVEFGERRVAVLASSSRDVLNSDVVQHVVAMKSRAHCGTCAIITNGRVTGAAQDFGPRNGCTIVGRDQFPDFVIGRISI